MSDKAKELARKIWNVKPPEDASEKAYHCHKCGSIHVDGLCPNLNAKSELAPVGGGVVPLPCPFCGSAKITVEWERCEPLVATDTNRRWFAECTQCACQGPFCQKEPQVISAWNKRADFKHGMTFSSQLILDSELPGCEQMARIILEARDSR